MNPGSSLKLGRIFGIEIGIHYSWFLIAILIILSLSGYFSEEHGTWASSVIWSMSILTAILFFAAIIVHELSHAFVARLKGLPVSSVTLFALGGVARIEKESENPQTEFWLGIVGPITSAVIGGVCLGAARVIGWTPGSDPDSPALAILVWLGFVNVALAAFNMLPGFPMDGGRVLRAIVWRITGDRDRATAAASKTGHLLAVMFIVLGLFMFFGGAGFGGLWIAFIGWFLLNAAKASYLEVELRRALGDLRVENLIENNFPVIESNTSIDQIVDDFLLKSGERWFMIVEQGVPVGLVTPREIAAVERRLWKFKTAGDVMRPIADLHTVDPMTPAIDALEIIGRENVNQLPVIDDGRLRGVVSRERIINFLVTRRELNL